jgi:hypothetical protein
VALPLKLVPLARDVRVLHSASSGLVPPVSEVGLLEVADAISVNPHWAAVEDAAVVVRIGPRPLLGAVGRFTAADEHRLEALRAQLREDLPQYLSYQAVEESCEILAERLVGRFGLDELRRFRFNGIPRGGLIVLAMLSYRLGLSRDQLEPDSAGTDPLVLVDDCSVTGLRFGEWLDRASARTVVFAHLYSHPGLREAIEAQEPRVTTCVSAHDFVDHARAEYGEQYEAWREERLDQGRSGRYWAGRIDQVAFPWSEPDRGAVNPVTGEVDRAWCLLPPRLQLRNRAGVAVPSIRVQVRQARGDLLRPHILDAEVGDAVLLTDMETEQMLMLEGTAADMWRAILRHRCIETALNELHRTYEAERDVLRQDLKRFLAAMADRGVLEWSGDDLRIAS